MAPSDVKRFAAYLNDLSQKSTVKLDGNVDLPTVASTDFAETQQLLDRFEDDERVRNVLMDPTEHTLDRTLREVHEALHDIEAKSIAAYIEESKPLNDLHDQIYGCDAALSTVEARLSHFDTELSTVNKEIQSLEEDSGRLGVMLHNRMAAAESLGHWLQDTTVPPELVHAVKDGDVADANTYTQTLRTLQAKIDNMHAFVGHEKLQAFPTLQGLEATAADRVRAFLLERIGGLKPGGGAGASNATIRRQGLLAFREFPAFLRKHAPAAYRAVLSRYVEDHRAHLAATVRTYMAGLAAATQRKERPTLVTAAELAGSGLNARLGHMFLPNSGDDDHASDFELGSRAEELLHPDFSRWPAQALRSGGGTGCSGSDDGGRSLRLYRPIALQSLGRKKVPHEHAFKALLHQLCDAAAGEFAFLEVFFWGDATHAFDECWKPVLAGVLAELDTQLAACPDVIGVLVMTRIVGHAQLQMTHAQVPVLQSFLDRLGLMLWPHFSRLIRDHISAVTADKANAKARALKPATPCVLLPVRRWAQLFVSVAKLNAEYNDSQIHNNLEELAKALLTLLYRIRLLYSKPAEGTVFHILNLRHVVGVTHAAYATPIRTLLSSEVLPSTSGGLGADAMAICKTIERDLDIVKAQYKEECLTAHAKELVAYVAKAQSLLHAGRTAKQLAAEVGDAAKARKVMQDFKDRWKPMVGIVQREVKHHFAASEACQREMAKACLEELYRRYKDFLGILSSQGGDFDAAAKDGPSPQTLAYELRELVR